MFLTPVSSSPDLVNQLNCFCVQHLAVFVLITSCRVCVCVHAHTCGAHMWSGGTCRSHFSPSIAWVPGIELRL